MTGLSTSIRVCSLTMRKTSFSTSPRASACVQPVSSSATAFMNVMRPRSSVAMTASPMLRSVVANHSLPTRTASSARFRSVMSRKMLMTRSTLPAASNAGLDVTRE